MIKYQGKLDIVKKELHVLHLLGESEQLSIWRKTLRQQNGQQLLIAIQSCVYNALHNEAFCENIKPKKVLKKTLLNSVLKKQSQDELKRLILRHRSTLKPILAAAFKFIHEYN